MHLAILSSGNEVTLGCRQKKDVYKGRITDILDEETLKLSLPLEGSAAALPEKGLRLELTFLCKKGLYQARGRIADRYKEDSQCIVFVHLTSELEHIQRKRFHRIPYSMEIEFRKEGEELEIPAEGLTSSLWSKGTTVEVSGGGCRFNSPAFFVPGVQLELRFSIKTLNGVCRQEWTGRVTDSCALPNRPAVFETRVEFLDAERQKREQLIKFIFEEERRIQQRERGTDH